MAFQFSLLIFIGLGCLQIARTEDLPMLILSLFTIASLLLDTGHLG
jgi:hypothetical protein